MQWKNVYVFISSTFNDMHSERDYLVKKVFPELAAWCARRSLNLIDIDLRWGITSEDAHFKNTVDICLKNVDKCRPFFLCFLGQRRGWVPGADEISEKTRSDYPDIDARLGKRAITEMEIEHALLSPMRALVDGNMQTPDAVKCAAFFVRSGAYVSALNPDQKKLFTNGGDREADRLHEEFIDRVRARSSEVYDYDCAFDSSVYSPELTPLGENVARGRLMDFACAGEPLAETVIRCLKDMILSEYPDRQDTDADAAENEQTLQEQKFEAVTRSAVSREQELDALGKLPKQPLYICSAAGLGKTTLVSLYYKKHAGKYDAAFIRYCGISAGSSDWEGIWMSIAREAGLTGFRKPEQILPALRKRGKVLIVIDGVDELGEGLSVLSTLPPLTEGDPELVLSFRAEREDARLVMAHAEETGAASVYVVPKLSVQTEAPLLVHSYLSGYLKALDDAQIHAICEKSSAQNPLFLKIILNELRVFGSFDQLNAQIDSFGETPASAFGHVLERLENDAVYADIGGRVFVPALMRVLCAKRGVMEIAKLREALQLVTGEKAESIADTLALYMRQLRNYLDTNGSNVGIAYDTLREAALLRYGEGLESVHRILAGVLADSEPVESIYHMRLGGETEKLRAATRDIGFLLRCIDRDGVFRLLRELEACGETCEDGIRECLSATAALIEKYPRSAPELLYKELTDETLRNEALCFCRRPFLKYEQEQVQCPRMEKETTLKAVFSLTHQTQAFCIAKTRRLAFIADGAGSVSLTDISTGKTGGRFTAQYRGRIKKMLCTEDAQYYAIISEDNSFEIFKIALGSDNRLLGNASVFADTCDTVRFGGVCMFQSGAAFVWQKNGSIFRFGNGQVETLIPSAPDRLCGYCDGIFIFKTAAGYKITDSRTGKEQVCAARINDCLRSGGQIVIAAEDKNVYLPAPVTLPESAITLTAAESGFWAVDRYGSIYHIAPDGALTEYGRLSQTSEILDTYAVITSLGEGRVSLVSYQRIAVFEAASAAGSRLMIADREGRLWLNNKGFILEGRTFIPRPEHLGQLVGWFENLKMAWSERELLYEAEPMVLRYISSAASRDARFSGGVSRNIRVSALVSSIAYLPGRRAFAVATTDHVLYLIENGGRDVRQFDLTACETGIHTVYACGDRVAVLSRRARFMDNYRGSAVIEDVLTAVDMNGNGWQRRCPFLDRTVKRVVYSEENNALYLIESEHILGLSLQTGKKEFERDSRPDEFDKDFDVAIKGDLIYCTNSRRDLLQVMDLYSGKLVCSSPTQRRITSLTESGWIIEDDEKLFKISKEG